MHGKPSRSSDPPAEITIYARNGTKFSRHVHKECPNRWCRKRFFYGFSVKDGKKVYESLIGKNFMITSSETAFAVDYCYEITLHCVHNNATFHGLENIYNQLHNFNLSSLQGQEYFMNSNVAILGWMKQSLNTTIFRRQSFPTTGLMNTFAWCLTVRL